MPPLIIANWKMNFTLSESVGFLSDLSKHDYTNNIIIAPAVPYIAHLALNFKNIKFSAQNLSDRDHMGAYTGEFSATMLKSCGCNYAIIGHSERIDLYNETDRIINRKVINCLAAKITPILCVGEPSEARNNNTYIDFIHAKVSSYMESIPPYSAEEIIVAYEPVWSIGSGIIPNTEQITEIFNLLAQHPNLRLVAKKITLVYGGSVNTKNYKQLLAVPMISGLLLGKSSLNLTEFVEII